MYMLFTDLEENTNVIPVGGEAGCPQEGEVAGERISQWTS